MIFFLCGFPGVGKSTIGKELAEILQIKFYDLDELVEQETGMSVEQLFKFKGEDHFRDLELASLLQFIDHQKEDAILALGGGTIQTQQICDYLLARGICIYLRRELNDLLENKKEIAAGRPLFENLSEIDLEFKIRFLFSERETFYLKSQVQTLVNSGFSAKKLATTLKLLTNRPQSL